jgi:hypothetical protein
VQGRWSRYSMSIPLIFSFWFMIIAYVIHVIDESLLEGSFGEKIRSMGGRNNSWQNSSGSTRDFRHHDRQRRCL